MMLRRLRLPLLVVIAACGLPATAPARAGVSESLLKKIYAQSSHGDAGDIYRIIKRALDDHPEDRGAFLQKLISKLEDSLDRLDNGVSKQDLEQVKQRLSKYLKRRQAAQLASSSHRGNMSPAESGNVNN